MSPSDPAIPTLGRYPEKTIVQEDTCAPVFLAAWFTVARTRKQPKRPQAEEWIKKTWYTHTTERYSAMEGKEAESSAGAWMDLETVIQSEASQIEKNRYVLMHIGGL